METTAQLQVTGKLFNSVNTALQTILLIAIKIVDKFAIILGKKYGVIQ